MRYARGWMLVDVISTIPWDLIMDGIGHSLKTAKFSRVMRLSRMARLVKLFKHWSMMEALQDWITLNRYMIDLLRMLALCFMVGHLSACAWAFVGVLSYESYDAAWFADPKSMFSGWDKVCHNS